MIKSRRTQKPAPQYASGGFIKPGVITEADLMAGCLLSPTEAAKYQAKGIDISKAFVGNFVFKIISDEQAAAKDEA